MFNFFQVETPFPEYAMDDFFKNFIVPNLKHDDYYKTIIYVC